MIRLKDGESMFGIINKMEVEDCFVVEIKNTGTANFYLDPKDENLNVDLYIYRYENENSLLGKSRNDEGKHELITLDVKEGDIYSIKVKHCGRFCKRAEYEIKVKSYEQYKDEDIIENDDYDFKKGSRSREIIPRYINKEGHRSAENYRKIIEEFDVKNSNRYKKVRVGNSYKTYCNIFMWDVSIAMDAEIPHRVDGSEINANTIYQIFLNKLPQKMRKAIEGRAEKNEMARLQDKKGQYEEGKHGFESWGWGGEESAYHYYFVTPRDAQKLANDGYIVVAMWKNLASSSGHVAMVVPQESRNKCEITSYNEMLHDMKIAQAGGDNYEYTDFINGFYSHGKYLDVLFFAHK